MRTTFPQAAGGQCAAITGIAAGVALHLTKFSAARPLPNDTPKTVLAVLLRAARNMTLMVWGKGSLVHRAPTIAHSP